MQQRVVCSKVRELKRYGPNGQAVITLPAQIVKSLPAAVTAFHIAQLANGLIVLVPINEEESVKQELGKYIDLETP